LFRQQQSSTLEILLNNTDMSESAIPSVNASAATTAKPVKTVKRRRRGPRWSMKPSSNTKRAKISQEDSANVSNWYDDPELLKQYEQKLSKVPTETWLMDWQIASDSTPIILTVPSAGKKYLNTKWLKLLVDYANKIFTFEITDVIVEAIILPMADECKTYQPPLFKQYPYIVPPSLVAQYKGSIHPTRIQLPKLLKTKNKDDSNVLLKYMP
jgi:hypothetical protein